MTVLTKNYPLWYSEEQSDEIENKDTLYLKYYEEFDSLGNVVVERLRDGDVRHDIYFKNNYDHSGTLVSRNCAPTNEFERSSLHIFVYNSYKQLNKEYHLGRSIDTTAIYIYEYNKRGQKISKNDLAPRGYSVRYEYDGKLLVNEKGDFHQWVFLYSEQGQLIKQILFYDSPDTITSRLYMYNSVGQVAQINHYDHKTKRTSVEKMTYNTYGYISEKTQGDEKLIYIYDYFH